MRALTRPLLGVALAMLFATSAQGAVFNLGFPTTNPDSLSRYNRCTSFLGIGGAHCTLHFVFTLDAAASVTILVTNSGDFKSSEWSLRGTSLLGSTGALSGASTIADLQSLALGPGTYDFKLKLRKGRGVSNFLIALDDPGANNDNILNDIEFDPSNSANVIAQTPIPGAALLFGSGMAALGFSARRRARRAAIAAGNAE